MKKLPTYLTLVLLFSILLYQASVLAYQPPQLSLSTSQSANEPPTISASTTLDEIKKRLDSLDEKIKNQNSPLNPAILFPFLSSILVALLAGGIALYNQFTQKRAGMKNMLLESLKWFEGGIQRRGIGIAVIDGNWSEFEDLRPTWISVLESQAIYVLSKSYEIEKDKPKLLPEHEFLNLERMLTLLKKGLKETDKKLLSGDPIPEVEDAFAKALSKHIAEGVKLSNRKYIKEINSSKKRLKHIRIIFQNT